MTADDWVRSDGILVRPDLRLGSPTDDSGRVCGAQRPHRSTEGIPSLLRPPPPSRHPPLLKPSESAPLCRVASPLSLCTRRYRSSGTRRSP